MDTVETTLAVPEESNGSKIWAGVMRASLALLGAKVDRGAFLRSRLSPYCNEQQVDEAIGGRPSLAGLPLEVIDALADSCIRSHVLKASGMSFAAGLPGGLAMGATIPADLVQLHWHALVLAQKLAYLYGWRDLLEAGEVDEQTELELTLLFGAMMGAAAAERGLAELAKRFSKQVIRRLPRQALTKTAYYPFAKQVGKWIGVGVTKRSFASGAAKVVPVIGGFPSRRRDGGNHAANGEPTEKPPAGVEIRPSR